MKPEPPTNWPQKRHDLIVRRDMPRNYALHASEGAMFMIGMAFIGEADVLTVGAKAFGAPAWLIALMPILMALGFMLPSMLVAHRIERLHRHKFITLLFGIPQRLAFLAGGLILFFMQPDGMTLALCAIVLAPLASGLIGGLTFTAWQETVAKTLPANRRASMFATRNMVTVIFGMGAGKLIAKILSLYPQGDPRGYGILFLITFACTSLSWILFCFLKEEPYPSEPKHTLTLGQNLRQMSAIIAGDKNFRMLLTTQGLAKSLYIVLPFLAIHALQTLDKPDSYVGYLIIAKYAGGMVGSVLTGVLGDKFGGKTLVSIGRAALLAVCIWGAFASTELEFFAVFFLFGITWCLDRMGGLILSLELAPVSRRATYLALFSFSGAILMLIASQLGAKVWTMTEESFKTVSLIAAGLTAISMFSLWRLKEPRNRAPVEPPPTFRRM